MTIFFRSILLLTYLFDVLAPRRRRQRKVLLYKESIRIVLIFCALFRFRFRSLLFDTRPRSPVQTFSKEFVLSHSNAVFPVLSHPVMP